MALAAAWLWRREADTDSHGGKPARRGAVLAAGALALLALLLGQGFAWQGASRWRWPIGPLPGAMTRTAGQPAYLAAAGLGRRADGVGRAAGPGGVALASLAHRPVAGGHRAGRERQLAASAHAADRGAGHFLPAFAAAVLGPGAAARRGLVPGALRVLPRAGADGRGVRAASLPRWPSVLGPALFDNRLEGELHWRVAHGGDAPQDAPCRPLARR